MGWSKYRMDTLRDNNKVFCDCIWDFIYMLSNKIYQQIPLHYYQIVSVFFQLSVPQGQS